MLSLKFVNRTCSMAIIRNTWYTAGTPSWLEPQISLTFHPSGRRGIWTHWPPFPVGAVEMCMSGVCRAHAHLHTYFYNVDKISTIKVVKEGKKSKNRKEKEVVKIKEENKVC